MGLGSLINFWYYDSILVAFGASNQVLLDDKMMLFGPFKS